MVPSPAARPTNIRAPHGAKVFEISWSDGHVCKLPHTILRGYCPCAGCQGHAGNIAFQRGGNLELRNVEQVGNYALQLTWGDAHASGIYSFQYLRRLCALFETSGDQLPDKLPELPAP